jgi:hypothetical protein
LCSYKIDRLSGNVLADLKSGNDHIIDAIRYSLEPLISRNGATSPAQWAALIADEAFDPPPPASEEELKQPIVLLLNSATAQSAALAHDPAPAAPVAPVESPLERRKREHAAIIEAENEQVRQNARIREARIRGEL